jgi:hypothetical protein
MFDLASVCRTFGGLLAIVLVGFMLYGCASDSTAISEVVEPVAFTTTLEDPADVTDATLADAVVKPADSTEAVATLPGPTMETSEGNTITTDGAAPKLDVDLGNTGAAAGSMILVKNASQVTSLQSAALPAGTHAIRLSPDTALNLEDDAQALTRALPCRLRITGFDVQFSVHAGRPASWTLPNSYRLNVGKVRRTRLYRLDGSMLTLRWNGRRAVPPADGKVMLTVNLYRDNTKVAGPMTKTVPVVNKQAAFTSDTHVEFNRADVKLDVRDQK